MRFRRRRYLSPREQLTQIAPWLLAQENVHVVLVAREIADRMRVWSEPVQFMVEPKDDGTIELILRTVTTEVEA